MAEFLPNLDDGESWLPSDILLNDVAANHRRGVIIPRCFSPLDELSRSFSALTLLPPRPSNDCSPPTLCLPQNHCQVTSSLFLSLSLSQVVSGTMHEHEHLTLLLPLHFLVWQYAAYSDQFIGSRTIPLGDDEFRHSSRQVLPEECTVPCCSETSLRRVPFVVASSHASGKRRASLTHCPLSARLVDRVITAVIFGQ